MDGFGDERRFSGVDAVVFDSFDPPQRGQTEKKELRAKGVLRGQMWDRLTQQLPVYCKCEKKSYLAKLYKQPQ